MLLIRRHSTVDQGSFLADRLGHIRGSGSRPESYQVRASRVALWASQMAQSLTETDYYYSYRESGYRVMLPDGHYWHVRRERVVAMGKLYDMGLSYSWSGEGTTEESIAPDSFSVTNLPSIPGHKLSRRRITFNPPLEQGQSAEYTFIVRCKQTGQPPAPFLSTRSSHRVDVLVLRVVFAPGIEPKKVDYVKRNTQLEGYERTIAA